jgi:hypothetical protein
MIPARNIESLTLRDKIRDAAQLSRALVEHLAQAVEPKTQQLLGVMRARPASNEPELADVTVRSHVAAVLESERFAGELNDRLLAYGRSIVESASDIQAGSQRPGGRR